MVASSGDARNVFQSRPIFNENFAAKSTGLDPGKVKTACVSHEPEETLALSWTGMAAPFELAPPSKKYSDASPTFASMLPEELLSSDMSILPCARMSSFFHTSLNRPRHRA